MEVKSSKRVSFASDFKEFDLEVEELDDDNCYQTYRCTGNDIFKEFDNDDLDYVSSLFYPNMFLFRIFDFCVAVKLN